VVQTTNTVKRRILVKLKEYLWDYGLTIRALSDEMLYSPAYVGSVISGKKPLGRRFARDVFTYTDGKVTEDEIVCQRGKAKESEKKTDDKQ